MKPKPKTKRRINYRLLRQIRDEILKRPEQFDMRTWFEKKPDVPMCGTTACIAGWAVALDAANPNQIPSPLLAAKLLRDDFGQGDYDYLSGDIADKMYRRGQRILGLNRDQCARLFDYVRWPGKLRNAYRVAQPVRAQIAAKRIDHFCKTRGRE